MHHRRHLRRQRVIVSQLQLFDGDRIIFIDHRNRSPVQKHRNRTENIFISSAVLKITPVQQNLRAWNLILMKLSGIFLHQQPLAHRRGRLLVGNANGPFMKSQSSESGRHRAGRDQNDPVPCMVQLRHLRRNVHNLLRIQAAVLFRQRAGADFHYNCLLFHSVFLSIYKQHTRRRPRQILLRTAMCACSSYTNSFFPDSRRITALSESYPSGWFP